MAQGIQVDGTEGPKYFWRDLKGTRYRAIFHFGRTPRGRLVIASVVVQPAHSIVLQPTDNRRGADKVPPIPIVDGDPGDVPPLDEAGVSVEVWKRVRFAPVRRYLESYAREKRPAPKRSRAGRPRMSEQKLRALLAEHRRLENNFHDYPAKTLAERHRVNRSTLRTWLRRARELA